MLQLLLQPVTLQDVNDTQVEHDPVFVDATLYVSFPANNRKFYVTT